MTKKKNRLEFDRRGGVIVFSRAMRTSPVYETMPAAAKVLMDLLHLHWCNDKPVSYGVREAAGKIRCNLKTAVKMFDVLKDRGFIECVNESLFNSRTGSKAREWRLTWMPFNDKPPSNNWEKWQPEK